MQQSFLIPANSKKSMLLFGLFTEKDLGLFVIGVIISLALLMILPVDEILYAIIALTPGCLCGFLVMPIPNYHNVRTFIKIAFTFYTTRQHFIWRGWCFGNGKYNESEK